jgi:copper(I)-binding protein
VSDRGRPRPTRAPLVVGALIAAAALTGCGAGQISQTAEQVAAVEGANAGTGELVVRNATIEYDGPVEGAPVHAAGDAAPLNMTIVNTGAEVDRLIAASSPVASSVQVSGVLRIPGGQALSIQGAPAAPVPAVEQQPTGTAGPGAAPEATPEPAPEATPEPAPGEVPAAPLPSAVTPPPIDEGEPGVGTIVLTGLSEDIQAGRSYPLVLTFERAGEVRVDVPVANPDTLREEAAH